MSSQVLNISKDGDSTASMGKVGAFGHLYSEKYFSAKENDTVAH